MIHTVLPGETLRGIAAMHGTGPDLLAAWNGTAEPLTGQELLVLHPQALHTVRCGESWQSLSARFGLPELRRCNPGPLRPGRRLVLGFRERGTRPLALCGTMGPEWNDLGLSYTCELAADAAELDGDGALHRLPLHGRPACLRLTGSGAKLETLLRSRAAQERLLLETAALCRACGTAQVELTVRDLRSGSAGLPAAGASGGAGRRTDAGPAAARRARLGGPDAGSAGCRCRAGARCARSSGAAAGKIIGGL